MWTGLVQYKAWVPGSTRSPGEVTRREATVIPFRVGGSGQGAAAPISFPRRGGREAVTGRPADATLPSAKTGEAPAPPPGLSGTGPRGRMTSFSVWEHPVSHLRELFDDNRRSWDARVPAHVDSAFYGVRAFLEGANTLTPLDRELVGEVEGQRLLHLMCHFGLDTLSWQRLGAQATGVDFSGAALAKARELNAQLGLSARF